MKTLVSGRIRQLIAGIAIVALGCCGSGLLSAPAANAQVLDREAAAKETMSYIVVDVASGKVMSQQKPAERRYPASTTKLMTAYLALEALRDEKLALDSPVIVSQLANSQAPSKMGFAPGSVIRLDQALRMMLVKSANDIAYAIGQTVGGGSMEKFVDMMNAKAAELGMADSHFVNPNGLPQDGQYSSARDLAVLASAIRRTFPAFSDYFGTEAISLNGRVMKNGNKLLGQFDGADGMKTGYICASGFNLVSSATRGSRTLVAVVMGANGTIPRERLSAKILEAGFETDPSTVETRIEDLPHSKGQPVDISNYICSGSGRTARANERRAEGQRDEKYGSPFLHPMGRSPVAIPVHLGGAAGNAVAAPGVAMVESYGIPIPTVRPNVPSLGPDDGEDVLAQAPDAEDSTGSSNQPDKAAEDGDDDGVSTAAGSDLADPAAMAALRGDGETSDAVDAVTEKKNEAIARVLKRWADEAHQEANTSGATGVEASQSAAADKTSASVMAEEPLTRDALAFSPAGTGASGSADAVLKIKP